MTRRSGGSGGSLRTFALALVVVVAAGCTARRLTLPVDPGTPFAGFMQVHDQVSAACQGVRTLTAVLALSGRAGDERLRGTVHAGFAEPDSIRLELRAGPLGTLGFVLVSDASGATLWLPRDARVVRGARAAEMLGALTGVTLAPADLQAILTGCVVPSPRPVSGRLHDRGWASIDLDGGTRLFLQQSAGTWRVRAARRGDLDVEYPDWREPTRFPPRVRLRTATPVTVDLDVQVSQAQTNRDLDAAAFAVTIPAGATPATLEELREQGPLRGP